MRSFEKIDIKSERFDAFEMIGKQWTLIGAEAEGRFNAMTASWGGFGVLWGKDVSFIVLRPTRYTKTLIDASGHYSLSFFGPSYREQLNYFGTVSGREENKVEKSGLTLETIDSAPFFAEAESAMICRKLYAQPMQKECFTDLAPFEKWYDSAEDLHTLYVGEITAVYRKR